uniref:peptidylprolyl isomerase n=2 Tax=Minutocellus polymorphus TaxID=265543 RepID=A0A7S0FI25_9STRA|mmetsp:Transcript_11761/g.19572  ORF Transcript_11761/g.19572 Transcript_11761/m.19572 type:complete len:208 (+) Transcript_11761:65-688(+)
MGRISFVPAAQMVLLIAAILSAPCTFAFSPVSSTNVRVSNHIFLSSTADDSASDGPFESYSPGSSLIYKELASGEGEPCEDGDVLTVAYKGKLFGSSGKQFDQSDKWIFKKAGGNCMPGFDQGLNSAKVNSKRIVRIPPELAYGSRGKGSIIPPNSDLEFEIEIKNIAKGLVGSAKLFGEERILGGLAIIAFMGIVPMLPPIPGMNQ